MLQSLVVKNGERIEITRNVEVQCYRACIFLSHVGLQSALI